MAARCRRNGRGGRARRTRGAELIEFTLAFLPLIALTFTLLDVAWSVFCKAALQYAVRAGVRRGITVTGAQAAASHSDLTAMVKDTVQRTSLGFLSGPGGLARIKVRYYQPPAPG